MQKSNCLEDYKYNKYSQHGEDGVIEEILNRIPKKNGWCVEFGAWDGSYLSNTKNLFQNKGYSAVLIEGNYEKSVELETLYSKNEKIITLNRFVGFSKKDNLDKILAETEIPLEFDFLSIDVDGNDYHIWKAVSKYKPKVVCIEFNPTIHTGVDFVQPSDPNLNQGSSISSIVKLGERKGYKLVSVLVCNAFFVKDEFFEEFKISDNSPEALRKDQNSLSYLFVGYDGTIFLRGNNKLPWHNPILIEEKKFQVLPKFLRKYADNYNFVEKRLFKIYMLLREFKKKIKL